MIATIRFYRGVGIGASLVRGFTHSEIGHVDLVAYGRTLEVRPSTGAHWTDIAHPAGDVLHVLRVDVPDIFADLAMQELNEWLPTKYDWYGAVAAGIPMLAREHATKFFCSEAVATWLHEAQVIAAPEPWRMQPVSLFDALSRHILKVTP